MLSKNGKLAVLEQLNQYVQSGGNLTAWQYKRLTMWLNGYTYKEIAAEEKISTQAVAFSVKRDLQKVQDYACKS